MMIVSNLLLLLLLFLTPRPSYAFCGPHHHRTISSRTKATTSSLPMAVEWSATTKKTMTPAQTNNRPSSSSSTTAVVAANQDHETTITKTTHNHHHRHHPHHRKIDEIAHELVEELGAGEIKPQVMEQPHGLNGYYHESLVHKLRRTIHEHDVRHQKELKILKNNMKQLEARLERTESALFWTELDRDYERDKRLRFVLWHTLRYTTQKKVKDTVGKATDYMLKFLHLYHELKEEEESGGEAEEW